MKPKNSKERNSSFLKFLLLFLVTTGTAVGAVYFNYRIPSHENELLRTQAKSIDTDMKFQSNFFQEMKVLKSLIDSLDVRGQNIPLQNSEISDKLVQLKNSIPTKDEESHLYDMHMSIVDLYADFQVIKGNIIELRDAESIIEELEEDLKACKRELKEAERNLRITR